MITTNQLQNIPLPQTPFVYIIDSPSSRDLLDGYTIGMAMRDALRAIRINVYYTLAASHNDFMLSCGHRLQDCISMYQRMGALNPIPFMHLCLHGNDLGVSFTDNNFLNWEGLKVALRGHNTITGMNPKVCMASCNGMQATNMVDAQNSVFDYLIGNTGEVYQSDLTVAYLTFYHNIFYKWLAISDAVEKMRHASGDHNFYFNIGEFVKQQKFQQLFSYNCNPNFPTF